MTPTAIRPRRTAIITSSAAVVAWLWMGWLVIHVRGQVTSVIALATCLAGTSTVIAVMWWVMPPTVRPWQAGYRACARDLAEDMPMDGYLMGDH